MPKTLITSGNILIRFTQVFANILLFEQDIKTSMPNCGFTYQASIRNKLLKYRSQDIGSF